MLPHKIYLEWSQCTHGTACTIPSPHRQYIFENPIKRLHSTRTVQSTTFEHVSLTSTLILHSHSCICLSSLFLYRFSHPSMQFCSLLTVTCPAIPLSSPHHQNNTQSGAKIAKLMEFSPALFYSSVFHRILSHTSSESICRDKDTSVILAPRDSNILETELRTSSANTSTQRHKFCDTLYILF